MFIRSQRLFLRPAWPEDWAELLPRIADEAVVKNLARAPWPYRAEDARAFAGLAQDRRLPHFFVTLPGGAGAELIGCVGLHQGDDGAELGMWIARAHWGRGFATEACRALLALARTLGHRRVVAHHFLDNLASARVLAKCGLRPTGKIAPRWCLARGHEVPAASYAARLPARDCDNDPDGEDGGGMMARFAA
jgi:RimJ/RimL family protein N-acetyltransferase